MTTHHKTAADARRERLENLLHGLTRQRGIPHAVLAVESTDGRFRWAGAAGQATPEGTPMHTATPFFIASIDKLFTATAILKLHERGHLDVAAPFADYLPRERVGGLHRLQGVDHTDRITVRHLLSHTSGLPDYLEDTPRGGQSLVAQVFADEDREIGFEEALEQVRRLTPHFPPQPLGRVKSRARYCDTNYLLLQKIVEAVAGLPLHTAYDDMLFRPAGLRHTWFAGESEPREATPPPAALWVGDKPLHIPRVLRSLQSIYSTAGDLIAFQRALLRGELFDDPATLALMQARWNRFGLPRDKAGLRAPGWPIEYALGTMRFRLPRLFTPLAPMPAVVGHSGSTGTWLFHCPELGVFIAGSVDQATGGAVPYRLLPKVLRVLAR